MYNKKRLGDILIQSGYISEEDLSRALKEQQKSGKRLGEILIEGEFITEDNLLKALEGQLGIERIHLDSIIVDRNAVKTIPEALSKKYNVLPIKFVEGELLVLTNDPLNIFAEEDVRIASGYSIKLALSSKEEIKNAISKCYSEDYMQKTA
ncbi:type II secretion system protein GspE, partial [Clostridium saudiense]|nr:type II secretion system protein GspE [Clostridium saudiense]